MLGQSQFVGLEAAYFVAQPAGLLEFEIGGGLAHPLLEIMDIGAQIVADEMRPLLVAGIDEHAIAVLIGEAPGNFTLAPATWVETVPAIPPVVPSALLQRRPDIAAAERAVQNANAQIGVQVSAYFPTISLTGSYGFAATELGSLFSSPNALWSYGAALAETVFDAGARRARVAQAKANMIDWGV